MAQGQLDVGLAARIGFSSTLLSLAGSAYIVSESSILVRGLELFGKTTRIDRHEISHLAGWAQEYPRIIDVLGKWGAKNPNQDISASDYYHIERVMKKIDPIYVYRNRSGDVDEFNRKLSSTIRKEALSNKAQESRGGMDSTHLALEKSKPKM